MMSWMLCLPQWMEVNKLTTPSTRAEKLAKLKQLKAAGKAPDKLLPLTYAQQRFWFLEQLDGSAGINNIFRAHLIEGALETEKLLVAITSVIGFHPSLRTRFVESKVSVKQYSSQLSHIPFDIIKVTDKAAIDRAAELDARTGFDLTQTIPCRFKLYQLNGHVSVFTLCIHHIIADGASVLLIEKAIKDLLNGAENIVSPYSLSDLLRLQHADFKAEQAYWLTTLENTQHKLTLTTDFQAQNDNHNDGAYCYFSFSAALSKKVKRYCRQAQLSPFAFFLSSFNLLMSSLSKQNNFIVGVPELNRNNKQARQMVGALANTLLVPAKIDSTLSTDDYLKSLNQQFYNHLANHQLPYEKLVELLNPERSLSHNPLFQVMFAFNNLNSNPTEPLTPLISDSALTWKSYGVNRHFSKVDVTLEISEQEQAFVAYFEYKSTLFSEQTVKLWSDYLEKIIEQILTSGERSIAELQLVDSRQALINTGDAVDNTNKILPSTEDIIDTISQYRTLQPTAIALVCGDSHQQYNYHELYQAYTQGATELQNCQVAHDNIIAISCQNRAQTIIAMLSCLSAKCGFVVLDINLPEARKNFILDDANVAAIISDKNGSLNFIKRDHKSTALPELAYIVYTSGSTGNPKGVKIPRIALSNHSLSVKDLYQLGSTSCVLQFSPLSFDLALEEIFPILSTGGTVITRPGEHTLSFTELVNVIDHHKINHLSLPTAYLHSWLNDCHQQSYGLPSSLRLVVIGTEQLSNKAVEQWFTLPDIDEVTLINAYGPSEATISCTAHKITQQDRHRAVIPIGKPLPLAKLYVFDEQLKPVPAGVTGELFVGGANLALGYQNLPEQTKQQFIIHPQSHEKLYRTGDSACYTFDGALQFKGRIDNQVKYRGYRIELDEINHQLQTVCGINQGVTCLKEVADSTELVAYFSASAVVDIDEIKQALATKLPSYMLPTQYLQLTSLPITERGKIDFNALSKLDIQHKPVEQALPATPIEAIIFEIWQSVLQKKALCCSTSFFTQGGHSLAALQVISRVKEALNKELSLKVFFDYPTIIQLANWLTNTKQKGQKLSIKVNERKKGLPLTQSQAQMWILQQLDNTGALYNMPYLLAFNGALNIELLQQSLQRLVDRHEAFRTIFHDNLGEISQHIITQSALAFEQVNLSFSDNAEQQAQLAFNNLVAQPFILTEAPAYKFILYRLADNKFLLGIIVHHINFDGSSLDLFTRELCQCYCQLVNHQPWQPAPLSIQTIDYAIWQQSEAGKKVEANALVYWQKELANIPEVIDIAHDKVRPAKRNFSGSRCDFELPAAQADKLSHTAQQLGCSNYVLALCATAVLLHENSRQEDFAIGIPVSGRQSKAMEPILGLFINSLPIRVRAHQTLKKHEFIKQIKHSVLSGFEHQAIPLHKLMQVMDITRSASHNPLFQVFFNFMHHGGDSSYQLLDDLSVSSPKATNSTARFDLSFTLITSKEGLKGHIEYSKELFDHETITTYCQRLVQLLSAFADPTNETLAAIEQKNVRSTLQRIAPFNSTYHEISNKKNIIDVFREHALCYPNKVALEFADKQYSYQQLLTRVDAYAASLQTAGVIAGDLIGVHLPRNEDLIVTLLAIFQCGAAYLPLDPFYPEKRLSYIVENSNVKVIISEKATVAFSTPNGCTVLPFEINQHSHNTFTVPEYGQDNLAYCIYTSGSTGNPKGVEVSQLNLLNLMQAMSLKPGFTNNSKLLALTPISFDISVLEIFLPLFNGGTLVLLDSEKSRDGNAIKQRLYHNDITHMQGTPASWRLLLEAKWQGAPQLIMLTGGEALPKELAMQLNMMGSAVWNMYGPTETTVWSSCVQVHRSTEQISIGSPISNTRFYVLNEQLKVATFGSKGQLAIAGNGVSLGYRQQKSLTDECFISLKLPSLQANNNMGYIERVYLTGDMVRQRADGSFIYLQRCDDQIKLRGYRIELAEIEAITEHIEHIEQCAVVISKSVAGDEQLVAYYIEKAPIAETKIASFLAEYLPEYMLPTLWIKLSDLPLTPSGKVDKKSLANKPINFVQQYIAPITETEKIISAIWQDILQIKQVGREDGFFKLGGNSIFAMQTLVKLSQSFGLEKLTLADLFRNQTVALLATHIENLQIASCDSDELAALLAEFTDK
jgi:amino acid adenylation domain-containing protein